MELVRAAGVRDSQEFLGDLKLPEEEQQAEDQAKELNLEEDDLSSTRYLLVMEMLWGNKVFFMEWLYCVVVNCMLESM